MTESWKQTIGCSGEPDGLRRRSKEQRKFGVSVVICCYNSSLQLPLALASIAGQSGIDDLKVEVIVVDNNSDDNTVDCGLRAWKSQGEPFELKIVTEPQQGLSYARKRGIAESQYQAIALVDDDNVLNSDYLALATALLEEHPRVAAFGGQIIPVFEPGVAEPSWFREIDGIFTVGSKGPAAGYCLSTCGAGLVLRHVALGQLFSTGFDFSLSDRTGQSLCGGGDVELCLAFHLIGWKVWYDPRLQLGHLVPSRRLTWSYAKGVAKGMGQAEVLLQPYRRSIAANEGASVAILCLKHAWVIQLCGRAFQAIVWRVRAYGKGWFQKRLNRETMVAIRYAAFVRALWDNRGRYRQLYRVMDRYRGRE